MNTEKWSKRWATSLADSLQYDEDKKEIIAYGLFIMIHTMMALVITALVGAVCGVLVESVLISFVIALLRKASGGIHATSPGRCLLLGTIVCVGGGILSKSLVNSSEIYLFIAIIGLCVWSYITIGMKAPVDSASKPIKNLKKKARLKKNSWTILTLYILLMLISFIYGYREHKTYYIGYGISILFGFSWQVLTLTEVGKWIIQKLDFLLINISLLFQGGTKNEKNES